MAFILRSNGQQVPLPIPALGLRFDGPKGLYEILQSTTIQMISLVEGLQMWMDEEEKFKSPLRPVNVVATLLLHDAGGDPHDFIRGDVVITEKGDWRSK